MKGEEHGSGDCVGIRFHGTEGNGDLIEIFVDIVDSIDIYHSHFKEKIANNVEVVFTRHKWDGTMMHLKKETNALIILDMSIKEQNTQDYTLQIIAHELAHYILDPYGIPDPAPEEDAEALGKCIVEDYHKYMKSQMAEVDT